MIDTVLPLWQKQLGRCAAACDNARWDGGARVAGCVPIVPCPRRPASLCAVSLPSCVPTVLCPCCTVSPPSCVPVVLCPPHPASPPSCVPVVPCPRCPVSLLRRVPAILRPVPRAGASSAELESGMTHRNLVILCLDFSYTKGGGGVLPVLSTRRKQLFWAYAIPFPAPSDTGHSSFAV